MNINLKSLFLLSMLSGNVVASQDVITSYQTAIYAFDTDESINKRIRFVIEVKNAWNKSYKPDSIKEAQILFMGGSGYDMSGVPNKYATYDYDSASDYIYQVPTQFFVRVSYHSGDLIRHMSNKPENKVTVHNVSEESGFSISAGGSSLVSFFTGGVSSSTSIKYEQRDFKTEADYNHDDNQKITWNIINETIRHETNRKRGLIYAWTNLLKCGLDNLVEYNDLPVVMRSDFKPQLATVYRKRSTKYNSETNFKITMGWTKSNLVIGRDWCTFYDNFSWKNVKDTEEYQIESHVVSISWYDENYHKTD